MLDLNGLHEKAMRMLGSLMRHRERYLKAWMAATGLPPTEAVLIERMGYEQREGGMFVVTTIEIVSREEAQRRGLPT